jgi:hypothetical protein
MNRGRLSHLRQRHRDDPRIVVTHSGPSISTGPGVANSGVILGNVIVVVPAGASPGDPGTGQAFGGHVRALALDRYSHRMATASNTSASIWDTTTTQRLRDFSYSDLPAGFQVKMGAVALDALGRRLAASVNVMGAESMTCVWSPDAVQQTPVVLRSGKTRLGRPRETVGGLICAPERSSLGALSRPASSAAHPWPTRSPRRRSR